MEAWEAACWARLEERVTRPEPSEEELMTARATTWVRLEGGGPAREKGAWSTEAT